MKTTKENFQKIPHLVQYQGSKRNLANQIIKYFPNNFNRLIEPFSGIAAISIACAAHNYTQQFLINDLNPALTDLLKLVVNDPERVSKEYRDIWDGHNTSLNHYNNMRDIFNQTNDPVIFLYLLARCVKGSVRYNAAGDFNQSPDKRRLGTSPEKMKNNIFSISALLKNKCKFMSDDYKKILHLAEPGDLIYMDPPYQGVSGNKDSRYYSGINFDEFVNELLSLNNRKINYVISYDGKCGDKTYGKELPDFLELTHIHLNAGRSSQATLLGRADETLESLYISPLLSKQFECNDTSVTSIPRANSDKASNDERILQGIS